MESGPINFEEIRQNRASKNTEGMPNQPAKVIDLTTYQSPPIENSGQENVPTNIRFLVTDQTFFRPEIQNAIKPSDYINTDGTFDCHDKKELAYKIITAHYGDLKASEHITNCTNCKRMLQNLEPTPADD